jgi:hypothetical protein
MLKIWLTCLQPSFGLLGVVLVLSNALSAYAAPKTAGVLPNKISKGSSQPKTAQPLALSAKGSGIVTAITAPHAVRFSASSYASPDDAVRRLALETIANSERKTPNLAAKTTQRNIQSGIASFIPPSTVGITSISTKSTKITTTTTPLVAGLFISNSSNTTFDASVKNFPNLDSSPSSPAVLPVVAKAIPTAATKVAEPLSVVQSTQIKPSVTQTAPQSNSLATNVTKGLEQFLGNEPKSVRADAAPNTTVAKGLEQFLGNEPKSIQVDSTTPIAKAIPVKTDVIASLNELVSPSKAATKTANASSLQLATSKAYDSAAEFDLPGVAQLQVVKTAQPKVKVVAVKTVKTVKTNLSTAVAERKHDYVALMSDKPLQSQSRQSGTTVSHSNSLGGLILGSRTNETATLPMKVIKAVSVNNLGLFTPENQY